jgi:hypothetical protein
MTQFVENFLLDETNAILGEAGFATRRSVLASAGVPWLLAEDQFFVIAVVVTPSLVDAMRVESFAVPELLAQVAGGELGAKKWDTYLVMLTEELADEDADARRVTDIQYNTRGVRRLLGVGASDRESLRAVLRPFLPLPHIRQGAMADALAGMADQLALNGVDRVEAERAIAQFIVRGDLGDF